MNDKGKDVNSDWLADQWDERSVLGHARVNKGRMKGDDPQVDTAQNPKRFDWRLALHGKIQKTFADSIPNKTALEFKRSYSQQTFVEGSEISWNPMKSFQAFKEFFAMHKGINSLCRFND